MDEKRTHLLEPASTGRARCRACGRKIERGELRFGERVPNPFADEGDTTLWFHPPCAAYRRPEPLLEVLSTTGLVLPERQALEQRARATAAHRRLVRVAGAERSPTAQARCRACREPIARGTWRILLVFWEDGRGSPGGFVHLACRAQYFEGHDVQGAVLHFSSGLAPEELADLEQALGVAAG